MKVDYSGDVRKSQRNNRKRRVIRNRIILASGLFLFIILVTFILSLTVFFKVESIKVVGSCIYSVEDIILVSGIEKGDNMIRLSSDDISTKLETKLPYIKEAEIIKSYPNKMGIRVSPAVESYLLKTNQGLCVADADYKVLRKVETDSKGLIKIVGIECNKLALGKTINFAEKQQRDLIREIIGICNDAKINVTYIDIESLLDIGFVIDGRLFIKVGSYADLSAKFAHLKTMLDSIDDEVIASISLENWSTENKKSVLKYEDISKLMK